jgi:hypothetical protein
MSSGVEGASGCGLFEGFSRNPGSLSAAEAVLDEASRGVAASYRVLHSQRLAPLSG